MDDNDYTQFVELREFAELAPYGLELVTTTHDGINVYSNKRINDYMKTWIETNPISKPTASKFIEAIDKEVMYIGYISKSKFKFLGKEIKRKYNNFKRDFLNITPDLYSSRGGMIAFYDRSTNKVYVFLDDNVGLLGQAYREVPPIITHEFAHYTSCNDTISTIKNNMSSILVPFYRFIMVYYLQNKYPDLDKKISVSIKDLFMRNEQRGVVGNRSNTTSIWRDLIGNYVKDKNKVDELIVRMFASDMFYLGGSNNPTFKKYLKESLMVLFEAYKQIGVNNPDTIPCQEYTYPSEVLAIVNQVKPTSSIIKTINGLNI